METESTSADRNTPELFVHVRFEVPATASSAGGDGMLDDDDDGTYDAGGLPAESRVAITEQHFDLSNCKTAMIGLPVGLGPVKPEPGDYAYSGMHDHGPLPPPREGGQFADIIGLVRAAKAASDAYLTDLIEREKTSTTTTTQVSAAGGIIKGSKTQAEEAMMNSNGTISSGGNMLANRFDGSPTAISTVGEEGAFDLLLARMGKFRNIHTGNNIELFDLL